MPIAKNGAIAGFLRLWRTSHAVNRANGSQIAPNIGPVSFWPGRRFGLAFLFRAPYLHDQSRHCESKVRLAPQGTGTTSHLQRSRIASEYQ
ncbi:hypothetical protein [Novosphingobium acidiphilum]|uniref:hypothetical protein n=1 Tax=Novosphingobium acidiphilum TaxID=505248 RepID=UPI00048CBA16|nr:hypothetical protein [Novosphingobium acidiphilum]